MGKIFEEGKIYKYEANQWWEYKPLSSHAVLDEVLAILMQDYKTLSKNNMDHKASGIHRSIVLIKNYRRKNFI